MLKSAVPSEASAVPLTVRGLTEIPYLEMRLHAGADGAERVITWAHAIEISQPWEWLEAGDLLMTVGLGLPSDPDDQVTYVDNLADADVRGIALSDGFPSAPLSEAMLGAAERRGMPILYIGWKVPFAQVSRAVAAANYGPQLGRLVKAIRVFDLVRASVAAHSRPPELLRDVETEIGCRVFVCTGENLRSAFGEGSEIPAGIRNALHEALEKHNGKPPSLLRLAADDDTVLVVPVPTERPAFLLAQPNGDAPPFAILQHVATVAALELERMWSAREERRRLGSETLAQLMQGHLVNGTMVALEQLGVDSQSLRMLAISETGTSSIADLHNLLADHRVDTMLLRRDGILYLLLIGADDSVQRVATLLPATARVGASEPFTDPTTTPIAAQQARWALGASTAERPLAHFGRVHSVFGARTPEEATLTVSTVLGPIIDYDLEHSTELLKSLRIFLHSNRSWKRAADELFIHKQTLMYRMRRVEDITGRKLNNTSDVAELWLALRAEDSLL